MVEGVVKTRVDRELAKYTLIPAGRLTPKFDSLLGLHFRNVLGDALRAERGLARRLSRVREGPRDIVFVPNWFSNCEVFPELP